MCKMYNTMHDCDINEFVTNNIVFMWAMQTEILNWKTLKHSNIVFLCLYFVNHNSSLMWKNKKINFPAIQQNESTFLSDFGERTIWLRSVAFMIIVSI